VRFIGEHRQGDAVVRVREEADEWVVEWEGLGVLRASRDGASHAFVPDLHLDPAGARKMERGVVAALVRHLRGRLTLHGSAVAIDGRAVVCVGASGAGKSTMAAALVRAGGELLADDMAAIELDPDPSVTPTEDHFSLDDAARAAVTSAEPDAVNGEGKWLVPAARVADAPRPLAAVLALRFGGEQPSVRPLRGLEVLAALVPCIPRFPTDDRARHEKELAQLERLATAGRVLELARPRQIDAIDRVVDLVQRVTQPNLK
jgi:hypothetical protein